MRRIFEVIFVCVLVAAGWAENSSPTVFVQSFRKGPTKVVEYSITAKLDAAKPSFATYLKDSEGHDRYQLLLVPQRINEPEARLLGWQIQLIDQRRRYLGNVLTTAQPGELAGDSAEDRAWIIDFNPYATVPLKAKRIFKVDGFYCVVQVNDFHLLSLERHLPESVDVDLLVTSKNPMAQEQGR